MKPHILIIEDNTTLRRLYRKVVSRTSVDVTITETTTVSRACELLKTTSFDLVISDLEVDDGNTLPALKLCQFHNVTTIAISAQENYREACQKYGATFYRKPLPTRKLADFVEKHLGVIA